MAKPKNKKDSNRVDPITYAKNVMTSAKYIAVETAKGVNPTLTSYISDNASAAKDMYNAVKDYKGTIRKKLEDSIGSKNTDQLGQIKKDIFSDLKSGKFYNPEREAESLNNLAESWGMTSFDFDMDDDFDLDSDDDTSSSTTTSSSTRNSNEMNVITGAIHGLGNQISYHQLLTGEGIAGKVSGANIKNTRAMMANNNRLAGMMNNSLSVINSSILDFHKDIADTLNPHIQNSTTFYQTATSELAKQTGYLENITKLLTERFAPAATSRSSSSIKETPWEAVMGGDLPNLGAWVNHAKNKAMEDSGMDSLTAIMNPEMLETLLGAGMHSPIALALTMALTSKIQSGPTGKALDRTVNIFRDGMMKVAGQIHKASKNDGILGTIASFFDITPHFNPKMNFGNYNKGRVDWTGKDSKALRDVIPTYLANIEALLSGREAKVFNYETGRYVTASKGLNEFKKSRQANIGNASRGMREEILQDFIDEDKEKYKDDEDHIAYTRESRAVRSLSDDYDKMMSLITLNHIDPSNFDSAQKMLAILRQRGWISDDPSKGFISNKNARTIARLIFKKKSGIGKMNNAIYSGQIANARFVDTINETNPMFAAVANGSGMTNTHKLNTNLNKNSTDAVTMALDDHGNNIFYYLQDYYKQIRVMIDSLSASNFNLSTIKNEIISRFNGGFGNTENSTGTSGNRRQPKKRKASSRASRAAAADAGAGGSDSGFQSLYNFNYEVPNNIAPEIITPEMAEASAGASEREAAIEDPEGRMVYNSSSKKYEAPKATSRGSFLKFEKNAKEHSFLSIIIDKFNDFMDNTLFGDAANTFKMKVEQEGGLFGYLQSLPNRIATGLQDLPDKIANKTSELWQKFQDSDFGKKFMESAKNIVSSFFKDTEQYAERKAQGTLKYLFKNTRFDKSNNQEESEEDESSIIPSIPMLPMHTGESNTVENESKPVALLPQHIVDTIPDDANPEGSYKGGLVNKSGMVSVSKGELIVPAKYNPLYNGGLSDKQREQIEHRNYRNWKKAGGKGKFFGFFAEGGTVGEEEDNSPNLTDDQANIILNGFKNNKSTTDIANEAGIDEKVVQNMRVEYEKDAASASLESMKKSFKKFVKVASKVGNAVKDQAKKTSAYQTVEHGVKYIFERAKQTSDYYFGDSDMYKNIKKTGNEIVKAAKVDLPKVAAGGALGALAGAALTGSGLGLVGGMAIGAGSIILKNSDTLSEALFGKFDENDKLLKRGILPPKMSKFITDKLPDAAKAGAIGATLGTFGLAPGGIMGGFVLGAGLDLVSDTNAFQNIMFGPKGADGERHGGIAGSIKNRVVDPLIAFTENGIDKIKNFFNENFVDPIKRFVNPLIDYVKGKAKSIVTDFIDGAKDIVKRTIGEKFDILFGPLVGMVKGLGKKAFGFAKGVVTAPFKALGGVGDALQRHNINAGYTRLSAEERDYWRKNHNKNKLFGLRGKKIKESALDKWELSLDKDKRADLIKDANDYLNSPTELKNQKHQIRQDLRDQIIATLPNAGLGDEHKYGKQLNKLMNSTDVVKNNDYSKVRKFVDSLNISDTDKEKLQKSIIDTTSETTKITDKIANFDINKEQFFREQGLDINNMSKKELRRMRNQLGIDVKNEDEKGRKKSEERLADLKDKDEKARKAAEEKRMNMIGTIVDYVSIIAGFVESLKGKTKSSVTGKPLMLEEGNFETPVMTNEEAKAEEAKSAVSVSPTDIIPAVPKTNPLTNNKFVGPKHSDFDKSKVIDAEFTEVKEDKKPEVTLNTDAIKEVINLAIAGTSVPLIAKKLSIDKEKVTEIINNNRAAINAAKATGLGIAKKGSATPVAEGGDLVGDNSGTSNNSNDSGSDVKTEIVDGQPYQYKRNGKGEWIINLADAVTKAAHSAKQKADDLRNKFYGMWVNGGILGKLKDLLSPKPEKEKKKTLLDTIKEKLADAASAVGGAISNFLGSSIGTSLTSFLGSLGKDIITNLPSILGTAATVAGAVYLGKKAAGTDNDSGMRKGMDPEARKQEVENSNLFDQFTLGVDSLETRARGKKMTTYEQDDHVSEFFTSKWKKRIGKNVLMSFNPETAASATAASKLISKIPVIGKTFGKPLEAGANAASIVGKAGKALTGNFSIIDPDKATTADKGLELVSKISSKILGSVKQILKLISKKLGGSGDWVDSAAEGISNALGKAGSKVSGVMSKLTGVIYFAQVALAVEDGFEDARAMSILGIIEKPSLGEKCLAAACNGINYAIPGIGGLIGTETIFNIVFNILSKFIKFGTLATKRAEAQETVKQYNEETGHTYDVEEYIYNVLNMSTTQDKVKSWAKNTVGSVKDTVSDLVHGKTTVGEVAKKAGKGIVNAGKSVGHWVAGVGKSAVNALDSTKLGHKVVSGVKTVVKTAGEKISKGVDVVKDAVSAFNKMQDKLKATFKSKDTTFADMVNTHVEIDEDNPLAGFTKGVGEVSKIVAIPSLYIGAMGKKLYNDVLKPTGQSLLQAGTDTLETLKSDGQLALQGDLVGLWKNSTTASQDNDMWFIPGMANIGAKAALTVPTMVVGAAKQAWGVIKGIGNGIKAVADTLGNSYDAAKEYCSNGDMGSLWTKTDSDKDVEDQTALGSILSATSDSIMKVALTIPTAVNWVGKKLGGLFSNIAAAMPDAGTMVDDLWSFTDSDKSMDDFSKTVDSYKSKDTGVFSLIGNGITTIIGGIMHLAVGFLKPFISLGNKFSNVINSAGDWVNKKLTSFKNWLNGDDDDSSSSNEASGSGSGIHTTQKDNYTKFGNSTIDADGCGPAVASTVLKAWGKKSNIYSAAKYAEKMGYVAGSTKPVDRGTKASYFGDIFSKNGISTRYTDNQSDINSAIASGNPTVLLGEDSSNTSKSNSPFGPNPHYVVARGEDKNGNVIVDDPELKGTALYKKNILKNVKLGAVTGGASGATDIINSGLNAGFNAMANTSSGPMSSIIKTIFSGGLSSSSTDSSSSDSYSYGDSSSGYVYSGDSPFPIVTSKPSANDPYISYYNNSNHGGQSTCINGSPTDSVCNVLSNCVGWVCGRFNHIYSLLSGDKTMKYKAFHCNAGDMYEKAASFGLKTGSTPQAGAIMVWGKQGGAGHVAIVEKVVSNDEVLTSESGYNSFAFKNKTRKKGNGNWGSNSPYYFKGFVYNPAVQNYYATHSTGTSGSTSENAKTIWNRLRSKGMSENGIAGLMGCWKNESNFNPTNLENKFEKKYGNDQQYTQYVDTNNKWPDSPNDHVGYGLAQWTGANGNATSGNRKHNLLAYAKSKGTSVGDLNTQVDFAYDEVKNTYPKAYSALQSASTPSDGAAAALGLYEMPAWGVDKAKRDTKYYPKRNQAANELYNSLHGTSATLTGTIGGSGSALATLDREAQAIEASRKSASGSKKPIPVSYDFTKSKNTAKKFAIRKKAISRGSASDIPVNQDVNTSSMSDDELKQAAIQYLQQIANNTSNNAILPAIQSILSGIISNMGSLAQLASSTGSSGGNLSDTASQMKDNIEQELNAMRSKLEAIASTP